MAATGTAPLTVGVAQIETVLSDLEANKAKHLEWIARGRAAGVDVLLFPEFSMTGHSAGTDALRLAIDRRHPIIGELAAAAGDMTVVFGFIEEGPAAQFYNSEAAVRNGELMYLHRKINVPTYGALEEGKHFAEGRYVETFEGPKGWRTAILTCADTWNPALVHLAMVHGATLLLTPISSAREAVGAEFDNPGGWELNLRFYAVTYGAFVIMTNRVGQEGDLTFWGGSRIVDPFGRNLGQAPTDAEALVTAELDFGLVRKARYLLPTVRDNNLDLMHREIERLIGRVGVPDISRIV